MRRIVLCFVVLALSIVLACAYIFGAAKELKRTAQTPDNGVELPLVRAIVFKDGFAYTFYESAVTPRNGEVILRTLPKAREGTLYAYIADGEGSIKRLEVRRLPVAERKEEERMPSNLYELLKRNEGKKAKVITKDGQHLHGTLRIITPLHEDTSVALKQGEKPPQIAYIALEGATTAIVRTDQIKHLEFMEPARLKGADEAADTEERLAIVLDGVKDRKPIKLGIAALEEGLYWNATYRILIDERPPKQARVELVATVDNQLAELKETKLFLAIGVPNFPYRHRLSSLISSFVEEAKLVRLSLPPQAFFESADLEAGKHVSPVSAVEIGAPTIEAAQHVLYETPSVSLKRGERASLTVFSQALPCREVFEWTITDSSSSAAGRSLSNVFWYALAIQNALKVPLTTGIATAYQEWRPIGQGMLSFTPVGEEAILRLTPATEVVGDHEEKEVGRTPVQEKGKVVGWLITIDCVARIRNTRSQPVTAIVQRTVNGEALSASDKPQIKATPPAYIAERNPTTQIRWQLTIQPGVRTLTYRYRKFVKSS